MTEKVLNTINKYSLLEKGDSVTVGFSGGADSTALISVLYALSDVLSLRLSAVHINHMIRGKEAERDESFVRSFCEEKGIPLTVFHRDIPCEAEKSGESEEECGRRIRYDCFNSVCGDGKIATAHTLSDCDETMIFNMLRGSSVAGLCSIPAKRDNIIRPLIECSREEIENYCHNNNLSFVTDSTNLSSDYTRNYLRREILPMFERVNPSYKAALSRLRDFAREDNAFLEKTAQRAVFEANTAKGLEVGKLLQNDRVIVKRALLLYIKEKCVFSPESRHISLLCEKLGENFTLQLSDTFFADIRNGIFSVCEKKEAVSPKCIPLNIGENVFFSSHIEALLLTREEFFNNYYKQLENAVDYDKISGSVFLRSRREGDSIYLFRRKITKTLKKLFCELKIPEEKRNKIAVAADSENVLWVSGIGANGKYRVGENTGKILLFTEK